MVARHGAEYRSGLADDRTVWLGNRRVDVATERLFQGSIDGIAGYFDYQHEFADVCLMADPETGEAMNVSLLKPRSRDDLRRRHAAFERFARYSMGFLGRTPDYVNVALAGHASRPDVYARSGGDTWHGRLNDFRREVVAGDLVLTHAIAHANVDKSRTEFDGTNADLTLHKIGENSEGIIVSGAKLLATLGPFADEVYVYPSIPIRPGGEKYALSFSVPVATPGLQLVTRDHYGVDQPVIDRPFSARFDEQDSLCIFDEVVVPWHRVFIDGNLDVYNSVNREVTNGSTQQQTAIRAAVKLEFAYDLCVAVARITGSEKRVAEQLGEVHAYLSLTRAVIDSAERRAYEVADGAWFVSDDISVLKNVMPIWMTTVVDTIKVLGSHYLLATPEQSVFDEPEIGPLLEKYLPGANGISARERAQVMRTAWDFAGSSLGGRNELYERYYLGSVGRARQLQHSRAQARGETGALREFLERTGRRG